MRRFAALFALCAFVSTASAQVYYEPIQYQYGNQSNVYYYGGSDPRVHYFAQFPIGGAERFGRAGGWNFASGDTRVHREVRSEPTRVFTDSLPFRYDNATFAGFTVNDARNDAYFNAPTYFRKSELLNAAVQLENGAWVVPAQAQPLVPDRDGARSAPRPTTEPRPLMIIPKDKLQQPKSDKVFAANR
jgi:hypothetical protein